MRKSEFHQQNETVYTRQLDSLSEAIEYMDDAAVQENKSGLPAASLEIHSPSWHGTATMEEAIEVARYGWKEGREYLKAAVGQIAIDKLVGRRHAFEPEVGYEGDEVDIGAYLFGDPENMISYPLRYDNQGKQATMFVNCTLSADVSTERIMRRGGALYAAIEALRADGYSLGLTMVEACMPFGHGDGVLGVEYQIPIVQPGQYLDLDTAAFCLAHPSFLRRLIFSVNEHEPTNIRQAMGYYGNMSYGMPVTMLSPLPPHSFLIDQAEGLDLEGAEDIQAFAQNVVDRTIEVLEAEPTD